MKAQEIKSEIQKALDDLSPYAIGVKNVLFLGEIAYQLAVANEREAKKAMTPEELREEELRDRVMKDLQVQPFVYPEIPK